MPKAKYWVGTPGTTDDYGQPIEKEFIDGKTRQGPWAIMTPESWRMHGMNRLGLGLGQRYIKQEDNRWLKVEG